jgi:PAS domain S-box-containing protein
MDSGYYPPPLPSPEEVRRRLAMLQHRQQVQDQVPGILNTTGQGEYGHANPLLATTEGLSLAEADPLDDMDDMDDQDQPEPRRRRSISHAFSEPMMPQSNDQSMSMTEFSNSGNAFQSFQFGTLSAPHNTMAGLGGFASNAGLPSSSGPFSQPGLVAMPGQGAFATLAPDSMNMAAFSNLGLGSMACSSTGGLWRCPDLPTSYPPGNLDGVNPNFAMDTDMGEDNPFSGFGLGADSGIMGQREGLDSTAVPQQPLSLGPSPNMGQFQTAVSTPRTQAPRIPVSGHSPAVSGKSRAVSLSSARRFDNHAGTPGSLAPSAASQSPQNPKKDVYSPSGFPMLQVLANVVHRKNPQVEIGAVDLTCSFVVCDMTMNDCPIVYASENFQNLTGYHMHEIEGQNCRFLQSPDGKVEAGSKREFVENAAVLKMRNAMLEGKEIQQTIINYRKGGKAFLNLLTLIPIPWEGSNGEMKYCVGFQTDLVSCPHAISGNMQVNYVPRDIGQYKFIPDQPSSTRFDPESGQTLSVEEVTQLLEQHNRAGEPSEWHKQSWEKMLLENADDVIHVLSLKGLFVYLSPACKRILEWDTAELLGTSLESVCHPSDIVSVTRELKEARQDSSIDVAFRIRRKNSGFTWFESHATLHHDQSKGKKYIILVGRERPVLSIRRSVVESHSGGIGVGEAEIWSKMSPSGLFLFVSSSAHSLLDWRPRELEGTGMQELLTKESLDEFGRTIEKARRGQVVGFKHEILHKKGPRVPAYTFFYPGDAAGDGQRCSFLIVHIKVAKATTRPIARSRKVGGVGLVPFKEFSQDRVRSPAAAPARVIEPKESEDDEVFSELSTTRVGSWQYELRHMEKVNRLLAEELKQLRENKKKRKRRKSVAGGSATAKPERECVHCHRRDTPEWRRGPSGDRNLCNSCGLRWAKAVRSSPCCVMHGHTISNRKQQRQAGKASPQSSAGSGDAQASKRSSVSSASTKSPAESSSLRHEVSAETASVASSGMEKGSSWDSAGSGMEISSIREEQTVPHHRHD